MRHWEKKRVDDISEHIIVTQIVCLLIFMMIAFIYFDLTTVEIDTFFFRLSVFMVIFSLFIVIYIFRYLLSKIPLFSRVRLDEVLLLAVVFPLTIGFLWYSGDFVGAKVLIIVPVIIATTAFGKNVGVGAALFSCAIMSWIDYQTFSSLSREVFQASLIVSSVAMILSWLVGGLMDVERKTQQELVRLADYDQLTGLYNHRYLQEKLAYSLQESIKNNTPLSLALLDINQFKYYNTRLGYQKGDELLSAIGSVLGKALQQPDYAARYGSDEFMLVYTGKTKTELYALVEKVKELILLEVGPILNSGKNLLQPFSISVGLAGYPDDTDTALPLIRAAEDDLYRIKYSKGTDYLYQSLLCEINALKIKEAFPTLQALISLVNSKDRYTFGHSERVMTYALALAEKMNLTEDELDLLRYGAALHDIGKIKIDTELLNKSDFLTKEEWETMKLHTIYGAQLVETISDFREIVPIIRFHHENYDGSGYPDGLQGEEIPLLARILRIADSFDAMTTDRPYKKALSYSKAARELKKNANSHYDPQLILPFIQSVDEGFFSEARET